MGKSTDSLARENLSVLAQSKGWGLPGEKVETEPSGGDEPGVGTQRQLVRLNRGTQSRGEGDRGVEVIGAFYTK